MSAHAVGARVMPMGWIMGSVCARVVPDDMTPHQGARRKIRSTGGCSLSFSRELTGCSSRAASSRAGCSSRSPCIRRGLARIAAQNPRLRCHALRAAMVDVGRNDRRKTDYQAPVLRSAQQNTHSAHRKLMLLIPRMPHSTGAPPRGIAAARSRALTI